LWSTANRTINLDAGLHLAPGIYRNEDETMRSHTGSRRCGMDFDWIFDWDLGMGPRKRGRHRRRGPGRRFFRQGEVRLALLSLLQDEPAHGYELMKRLEERSGGMYRASAGTVYPVLQQLEDEGLVRIEEADGKKVYNLTEAGREELLLFQEDVERIWTRATGWKDWSVNMGPETAEIWGSWGRLSKAAFKAAAKADFENTERVREILDRARKELEEL
jgi:DNA-binding PadR family transcriptional regulator